MRILHIPATYAPVFGGAELHCQKISEFLVNQGHQVRVLTGNVGAVDGYYTFGITPVRLKEEVLNGVEIKRVPYGKILYKFGSLPFISKLPWQRARNKLCGYLMSLIQQQFLKDISYEIQAFQPDVVMVMPHLVVNVKCVLLVHLKKPFPLVMAPLLHEEDPQWPIQEMKTALCQADAVVSNTEYESQRLADGYQVPRQRIFTCYLGVDIPPASSVEASNHRVLFLGRKVPSKGLPDLLAAMRLVWKVCPDTKLILAGARVQQTKEIDSLIDTLPETERRQVISLDNVSESRKSELLSTSTCLVLPSRIESFGIVLLEAWAHSLPVITLNLPVFRSIVTPNVNGLLTKPGSADDLSDAILFMLQNPEIARTMGQAGRVEVERRFTWDRVAARYLQAYEYAVTNWKQTRELVAIGRES